ncbi:MAG: IPExxxVDY family protein [Chitinophagales bacterium]
MSKEKIPYQYDFNYKIIAISTHLKDYRVSFFINECLGITLEKTEDLKVDYKSKNVIQSFEMQHFNQEEIETEFFLIHNKSSGVFFLPSLKKFDYLLLIKTENQINNQDKIIESLNENQHFQIVYKVAELSSRENNIIEKNILYQELE